MTNYQLNKIKGVTMIEYVLIAGLISIAAVALLTPLGGKIVAIFQNISNAIP